MNRAERRARAKQTPAYKRGMTREDKIKALYKNGITMDDLKKNADDGYKDGWEAACKFCMNVCYAASVRALHELEGYGPKRNRRFLQKMDGIVINTMSTQEAIDAALEDAGIKIVFSETFAEDRIQETTPS